MSAIVKKTEDVNCSKCLIELESEGLKCNRCHQLMHLRCSDLPEYMLLRFRTSQAHYICRSCVLGEGNEESLQQHEQEIRAILAKEEKTIEEAGHEIDKNQ